MAMGKSGVPFGPDPERQEGRGQYGEQVNPDPLTGPQREDPVEPETRRESANVPFGPAPDSETGRGQYGETGPQWEGEVQVPLPGGGVQIQWVRVPRVLGESSWDGWARLQQEADEIGRIISERGGNTMGGATLVASWEI